MKINKKNTAAISSSAVTEIYSLHPAQANLWIFSCVVSVFLVALQTV
jgi:hypothetical protein